MSLNTKQVSPVESAAPLQGDFPSYPLTLKYSAAPLASTQSTFLTESVSRRKLFNARTKETRKEALQRGDDDDDDELKLDKNDLKTPPTLEPKTRNLVTSLGGVTAIMNSISRALN